MRRRVGEGDSGDINTDEAGPAAANDIHAIAAAATKRSTRRAPPSRRAP
jgi:hypothetical protein